VTSTTSTADTVWLERLLLLLVTAAALATLDQAVKHTFSAPAWTLHQRSALWFAGCCLILVAATPLARVPSKTVALAAGIFCGGVLGNLLSASEDALQVPNPIVVGHASGAIAFNVADLFILGGNVLLMASLMVVVIQNRERLPVRDGLRLRRRR
jgi:protein-S-isoprenylcysteine O-methyltransferase Ste14